MPDYKEMYLKLFRASEEAVNLLIAAQQECEEMYVSSPEPELKNYFAADGKNGRIEAFLPPPCYNCFVEG